MWECPDFFKLDGKHTLLFSPQGMKEEGDQYQNLFQTGYLVGTYTDSTKQFKHGDFKELDFGQDFYAVQTLHDDQGRTIAIGWMDMWESEMPTKEYGWCGAMTLPRELSLSPDDRIIMKPIAELESLREEELPVCVASLNNEVIQTELNEELLELKVMFSLKNVTAKEFGVKVRCSEDGTEETVIGFDVEASKLVLNREHSGVGVKGVRKTVVDLESDTVTLHIYVERSSVEVFVNEGETTMTSRIYPKTTSLNVQLYALGGSVDVDSIQAWKLADIGL